MISVKRALKESHKILGLVFCVFIAIIGVSGAILVYDNELSRLESGFLERNKQGEILTVEETISRFLEQKPNAKIGVLSYDGKESDHLGIRAFFDKNVADPNDPHTLYGGTIGFYSVSRYDGEILSVLSAKLMRAITMLHVSLDFTMPKVAGEERAIGSQIVGISTIVIILLSITGLYFYIPMLKRNFSRNIKPDFKAKGYAFWYKLHNVTGVYTCIFVLIMCLTGLYFQYDWFKAVVHTLINYEREPYERVERESIPKPFDIKESAKAFQIAIDNMPEGYGFMLFIPDEMNRPYGAVYKNRDYVGYGGGDSMDIDMENNKTTYRKYGDASTQDKILSSISQLHYGTFFGEIGKALWCLSSLAMALFGVSGAMMFYRRIRRPRKNTPPIALRFLKAQA
jgi:sulfite reductase (NADPH) flavoprotein alpha-component